MLTLWTVNYIPGEDPLERHPVGIFYLERPLKSSKLKFKGFFLGDIPPQKDGVLYLVTSLTVHTVCFFLALNGKVF